MEKVVYIASYLNTLWSSTRHISFSSYAPRTASVRHHMEVCFCWLRGKLLVVYVLITVEEFCYSYWGLKLILQWQIFIRCVRPHSCVTFYCYDFFSSLLFSFTIRPHSMTLNHSFFFTETRAFITLRCLVAYLFYICKYTFQCWTFQLVYVHGYAARLHVRPKNWRLFES